MISFLPLKCKLGSHQWNTWKYVKSGSCHQCRRCEQCQAVETRQNWHQWSAWEYIKPNSCEQQRWCRRCQAKETRTGQPHVWGNWEYIDIPHWQQSRICRRCLAEEIRTNQPTDSTEQLKLLITTRLKAGESIKRIFDELVAIATPNSGTVIAQHQAKAILSEPVLRAITPDIALRLKKEEREGTIRTELTKVYREYVLFPDDWARKVVKEARVLLYQSQAGFEARPGLWAMRKFRNCQPFPLPP